MAIEGTVDLFMEFMIDSVTNELFNLYEEGIVVKVTEGTRNTMASLLEPFVEDVMVEGMDSVVEGMMDLVMEGMLDSDMMNLSVSVT